MGVPALVTSDLNSEWGILHLHHGPFTYFRKFPQLRHPFISPQWECVIYCSREGAVGLTSVRHMPTNHPHVGKAEPALVGLGQ